MAHAHALSALRRLYGELLGQDGSETDKGHVAAVLRMLNPSEDVEAIQPIRSYVNRRGTNAPLWYRSALNVMRQANEPLTARQIATRVLAANDMPYSPKALQNVRSSILNTFRGKAGIAKIEGKPARWNLCSSEICGG